MGISKFINEVKEGKKRGDFETEQFDDDVVAEASVGSFEYGRIHLRIYVENNLSEISPSEGMYYNRLYKVDKRYEEIKHKIGEAVNSQIETPVEHRHVWTMESPDEASRLPFLPDGFSQDNTLVFTDTVQIRNDVSVGEAIATNRTGEDHMTRDEYEEFVQDSD